LTGFYITRRLQIAVVAAASLCAASAAYAQAAPDNQWHGNFVVGGAFASGNTSTLNVTLAADAAKATAIDRISLSSLVNYGRTQINGVDTTTADQAWLRGRYDYNLSEKVFAFGGAGAETNRSAGTESRYSLTTGLGYKLIRSQTTSFDVFAGVGYAGVNYTDGSSATGGELLVGEESTHKLTDTTSVRQRFEYRPGQGDLGNLATFTASMATAIIGGWTLNVGLAAQWASIVPVGSKSTDVLMTVGFGYKF
jgi:putative salt-induced outer membrane protein